MQKVLFATVAYLRDIHRFPAVGTAAGAEEKKFSNPLELCQYEINRFQNLIQYICSFLEFGEKFL